MGKRKVIGIILAEPEGIYQQHLLRGIFDQCCVYGYNAAVFASLSKPGMFYKDYQKGEANIYELINFDLLDGVIIAPVTLSGDAETQAHLLERLQNECRKPVVSIDMPYGNYPVSYTENLRAFAEITEHIIKEHKRKKIYFLSGQADSPVSGQRIEGYKSAMTAHGLDVTDDMIFYGDFWYTGGEMLADRIASGDVPMPEAVVCASDHMAIGLANRLAAKGIKVPEQVIVTGYDGIPEAVLNDITITTCVPDVKTAAAKAVNMLRKEMEPHSELKPVPEHSGSELRLCASCGCPENTAYIKKCLSDSLFSSGNKLSDGSVDIGTFLESYMFENFAGASDVDDCLIKICGSDYLITPYSRFFLCLKEEWLNTDDRTEKGYPEKMKTVIFKRPQLRQDDPMKDCYSADDSRSVFETKLMLPQLWESSDEPTVTYFSPVHYITETLGYCALECSMSQEHIIGNVYRNWLRNVNAALEMIRVRAGLQKFSERDAMTGLYNRRGMAAELDKLMRTAKPTDRAIVFVIDMDRLKYINDTFGHSEGDYGIRTIAHVTRQICKNDEICVRAGGDEFYIIGIGDYNSIDALVRAEQFNQLLAETDKAAGKPYEISASIGCCCESLFHNNNIPDLLKIADSRMYNNKIAKKKQREQ